MLDGDIPLLVGKTALLVDNAKMLFTYIPWLVEVALMPDLEVALLFGKPTLLFENVPLLAVDATLLAVDATLLVGDATMLVYLTTKSWNEDACTQNMILINSCDFG